MMKFKQFNEAYTKWTKDKKAEFADHVKNGLSNKEIGAKMGIKPNHVKQMYHRFRNSLKLGNKRKAWGNEEISDLKVHGSNPDLTHKTIAKRLNDVHDNNRSHHDVFHALKYHYPDAPKRSGKGQRYRWDAEALKTLKASHSKYKGRPKDIGKDMDILPNEISQAIKLYGHEIGIKPKNNKNKDIK